MLMGTEGLRLTFPLACDIDLAAVRDVDELVAMGSPRLKAALRARGMRAGGSAPLLAERLWWKCKLSATNSPKFTLE